MLKNYLKVAFRNIVKHKLFSLINMFGLSISMATCLLIILLVYSQKKVDGFHEKRDRIVRVLSTDNNRSNHSFASTPLPLGTVLLADYPHLVEDAVRIKSRFVGGDVVHGDNRVPLAGRYVDARFFEVFDFGLMEGNPETALQAPFSIVLAKTAADKLFGNESPIGKSVKLNDVGLNTMGIDIIETGNKETLLGDFTVTGVVDTSLPSHIQFDFLVSMATVSAWVKQGKSGVTFDNWQSYADGYLYVLLKEGKTESDLMPVLQDIAHTQYANLEEVDITFGVERLSAITPGTFRQNPISLRMPLEVIYFLSFLGLVVLFSACFNYVNLSFARSLTRTKEIGVRKTMGAARYQVFMQFMTEAVLIGLLSLVIALGILQVLSRVFLGLWINQFLILDFTPDVGLFLVFILFSIVVGCLAGLLPASFLSSFSPIKTLRNASGITLGQGKRLTLRKGLVVLQFCASLFFIITTLLIFSQLKYLMEKEYGFDQSHMVNVKLQGVPYETLADALRKNPAIETISASSFVPGTGGYSGSVEIKRISSAQEDKKLESSFIGVDQHFLSNLEIPLKAGSDFPLEIPKSDEDRVIVNEAAAQLLGYTDPKTIVGETLLVGESEKALKVIGLTGNFIFDLLAEADPGDALLLRYLPHDLAYMNVRYHPTADTKEIIAFMEQKWKQLDKVHSFKYEIYEEELKATNAIFADVVSILGFISFLAIVIATLGLLGMAAFTAESKRKEIGIRKVLGAQVRNITLLLSNGFLRLFAIAVLVTVPLAYLANMVWLEEFAYKVNFSLWIIILGVGIMFVIGFGTILSQTLRAARNSPLKGLREE